MNPRYASCASRPKNVQTEQAVKAQRFPHVSFDEKISANAHQLFDEGNKVFRDDTFGSESFWGDQLHLHRPIVRREKGGVGEGLTPRQPLQLGLKLQWAASRPFPCRPRLVRPLQARSSRAAFVLSGASCRRGKRPDSCRVRQAYPGRW